MLLNIVVAIKVDLKWEELRSCFPVFKDALYIDMASILQCLPLFCGVWLYTRYCILSQKPTIWIKYPYLLSSMNVVSWEARGSQGALVGMSRISQTPCLSPGETVSNIQQATTFPSPAFKWQLDDSWSVFWASSKSKEQMCQFLQFL